MEQYPHQLVSELHGRLLRALSARAGKKYQGLEQLGRDYHKMALSSGNAAKKLAELDACF